MLFFSFSSPELEKGLKKRVKLHTHENGENGQSRENGQNGQNEDIDSDDTYTEVSDTCGHIKQFKTKTNGTNSDVSVRFCA